jgi:neurabin
VHSSITDEGGFNEPSPEIKALSPVYDFENDIMPPVPPIPSSHPDVICSVTYVDLAHRAQPEGIESDEVYDENESYRRLENGGGDGTNDKIVYATIKPELPVKEVLYEKENILDIDADDAKIELVEPERGYVSPQRILDPTRTRLHDDDEVDFVLNKKLPPEPPGDMSETETEEEDEIKPARKVPPPIPELNSPLDLQDVEFADASDDDENVVNSRRISNASEPLIPDAMTSDEADRLLSSR